jgi:hypothetical protein
MCGRGRCEANIVVAHTVEFTNFFRFGNGEVSYRLVGAMLLVSSFFSYTDSVTLFIPVPVVSRDSSNCTIDKKSFVAYFVRLRQSCS